MPDSSMVPSSRHYALNDARDAGYRALERYDAEQALDEPAVGRRRPELGPPSRGLAPGGTGPAFRLGQRDD